MQIICTSLQADNHASTSSLNVFTGRMLFLMPNQQCQGLKEILSSEHYETPLLSYHHHYIIKTPAAPRVLYNNPTQRSSAITAGQLVRWFVHHFQ